MPNAVFLDTGFFKALVDSDDDFHSQAERLWQRFMQKGDRLITSNFIVDEALTVIRIKCSLEKAVKFRDLLAENSQVIRVVRITVADEGGAWKWFVKHWSGLSFIDCVSFSLMERLGIKRAAAFDEHFKRAGFKVN